MIKVLIVDDESLAIRRLEIKLSRIQDIEVVGYCRDGDKAKEMLVTTSPDLTLLDINMPGANGFDVADRADELGIHVIFVTAFNQYAVQAFEQNAVDYLLKPVSTARLEAAIDRYRHLSQQEDALENVRELKSVITQLRAYAPDLEMPSPRKAIWIKNQGRLQKIQVESIEWIEAARDYVSLHMINGRTYFVRDTMNSFEKELESHLFQRTHRSSIVNLSQIREIKSVAGSQVLQLNSGMEIKVGRSFRNQVKLRLSELFGGTNY